MVATTSPRPPHSPVIAVPVSRKRICRSKEQHHPPSLSSDRVVIGMDARAADLSVKPVRQAVAGSGTGWGTLLQNCPHLTYCTWRLRLLVFHNSGSQPLLLAGHQQKLIFEPVLHPGRVVSCCVVNCVVGQPCPLRCPPALPPALSPCLAPGRAAFLSSPFR